MFVRQTSQHLKLSLELSTELIFLGYKMDCNEQIEELILKF